MHILIVEDDPVVADVLGMTLDEAGHFPLIAHTIEVARAELRHNDIDVFICKLRRKLELAGATGVNIDTVWGQGCILRETHSRNGKAIPKASQITNLADNGVDAAAQATLPRQRPAAQRQIFSENSLREFHEESQADWKLQAGATRDGRGCDGVSGMATQRSIRVY